MLPRVVDLVRGRDIPVIAAGGIIDERGYVAALALGAQGVALGTRFELYFISTLNIEFMIPSQPSKMLMTNMLQVPCNRRELCSPCLQAKASRNAKYRVY